MQIAKGAIRFSRKDRQQFFSTLNKRVNAYFKENNLRKTGNWRLQNIYYSYVIAITGLDQSPMAGIGMNVMHEGNHGSYNLTNS